MSDEKYDMRIIIFWGIVRVGFAAVVFPTILISFLDADLGITYGRCAMTILLLVLAGYSVYHIVNSAYKKMTRRNTA